MLPERALKDLLSQKLSDKDKALICLAVEPAEARPVKDVTSLAYAAGWRASKKKNLSAIYRSSAGLAVRTADGWELTLEGRKHVAQLAGPLMGSPVPVVASSLRAHLTTIADADTQAFVEEAIACFEARQHRAATVLAWVGAVSALHKHVIDNHLSAFNTEALRRDAKWKAAKTTDDLGLMKESDFLDVLQAISVLAKNTKVELKKALDLRNACGHPNSYKLAEHKVSAHIEDLILNVFSQY